MVSLVPKKQIKNVSLTIYRRSLELAGSPIHFFREDKKSWINVHKFVGFVPYVRIVINSVMYGFAHNSIRDVGVILISDQRIHFRAREFSSFILV